MIKDYVLVINPRPVRTRVAIFQSYNAIFLKDIFHPDQDLGRFSHFLEQIDYRTSKIIFELEENGIDKNRIAAVVGRGGLMKPVESGIYEVNERIIDDLKSSEYGEDTVNLGGILADEVRKELKEARAFIVDPVTVDELCDEARITGHPEFDKKSVFHALNQKAIARQHAKIIGKNYNDMNLIVVHLGSGISVSAHAKGRVVDTNQVLDGDGPFSPERTGSLPLGDVIKYCFHSGKSETDIMNIIQHKGGLYAYLGTYSALEVDAMVTHGDEKATQVFGAMAYQVCKEIGAMYAVLKSNIDGIIITGGIANSKWFVNKLYERVGGMGSVHIYPGVIELEAMAHTAMEVLRGEEKLLDYK